MTELTLTGEPCRIEKTDMTHTASGFHFFPSDAVPHDSQALIPLVAVNDALLSGMSDDPLLLAFPATDSFCDLPAVSYAWENGQWQLDTPEDLEECDPAYYLDAFYEAKAFFETHGFLQYPLSTIPNQKRACTVLSYGGQPQTGQNWDAYLWDEDGEDYDLLMKLNEEEEFGEDAYTEEGDDRLPLTDKEYAKASSQLSLSEGDDAYHYVATIVTYRFMDEGPELIYFYNAEKKRFLVVAEYS